jgi:hypothetical protein
MNFIILLFISLKFINLSLTLLTFSDEISILKYFHFQIHPNRKLLLICKDLSLKLS